MDKSSYSKVDEYGFERPDTFSYDMYDRFMSQYMRILARRAQKWKSLKDKSYRKTNTLKRFVRKGIPSEYRKNVWMKTSGAELLKIRNVNSYSNLKLNFTNSSILEAIKIDLPRTFPDNLYFSNHSQLPQSMFNVLAAFAHQNIEVGYCQGLNYIAGLLLLSTKDEESSFWLLKVLVEYILPKYYIATMSGLLTDLDVLDDLVLKLEPAVHRHVHQIGMPWAIGCTKWFICLFSEVLPTETVLRIWDCLFYEGSKIIFRVALTLIKLHKKEIMKCDELGDLINCFRNMKNHESVINCHQFMELVIDGWPKFLWKNEIMQISGPYGNSNIIQVIDFQQIITDVFKLSGSLSNDKIKKLREKHKK